MYDVNIVIVNYKMKDDIEKCLDSFYKDSLDPLIAAAGLIGIFESSSRALVYLEKRGYVNLDYERMLRGYPVKNQSIHSTSNDTNKK